MNAGSTPKIMGRRQFMSLAAMTAVMAPAVLAIAPLPSEGNIEREMDEKEGLEAKVTEKVMNSSNMTPYGLRQLGSVRKFSDNDISLVYDIFRGIDDSSMGKGSINFDCSSRIMDIGIDSFDAITDLKLFLASSFLNIFGSREKYSRISEMQDMRTYCIFDDDMKW
jgi:hypothetical protein